MWGLYLVAVFLNLLLDFAALRFFLEILFLREGRLGLNVCYFYTWLKIYNVTLDFSHGFSCVEMDQRDNPHCGYKILQSPPPPRLQHQNLP